MADPSRFALGTTLLLAACAPPEAPSLPLPEPRAPEIRIGVVIGAGSLSLGGGAALRLSEPDGGAHLSGYRSAVSTDFGINTRATNPFALKRIASYFALRNPRNLWLAFRP